MNRSRATVRTLVLLLLVFAAPLATAQGDAGPVDLPVTRVVLFTTGVGYFEHAGTVVGGSALAPPGAPTLAQLLDQARGEALRIETDVVVEGTLVNVERTTTGEGDARTLLTLATADGLRRVA